MTCQCHDHYAGSDLNAEGVNEHNRPGGLAQEQSLFTIVCTSQEDSTEFCGCVGQTLLRQVQL